MNPTVTGRVPGILGNWRIVSEDLNWKNRGGDLVTMRTKLLELRMNIKLLKKLLWMMNALLVLGVVGVVLKFFLFLPASAKQSRSAEDILGQVIQQGRRTIERDKPDPPITYRNTHELAINGAPPPPPEVIGPGSEQPKVSPLARNYELAWQMLDPEGWGSYAHLLKLSDQTIISVEVGEMVDGAWKLIRVGVDDAEFEDETSGTTVTLVRKRSEIVDLDSGVSETGSANPSGPGFGSDGRERTPEEDFKLGPIKGALKKTENHYEMPVEEAGWWGRNYEQVANQVALQPVKDPETGRPDGVLVKKITAGSMAQRRGLLPGDKIKSVNGTPVNSRQDAINYYKGPGKGLNRYLVVIERKGRLITLTYDVRR